MQNCKIVWRCEEQPQGVEASCDLTWHYLALSKSTLSRVNKYSPSLAQVEQRESRGVESVMNRESPQHVWMILLVRRFDSVSRSL